MNILIEMADQLEEPIFFDPNAGESQRVHLKLNRMKKSLETLRLENCY